MTHGAIDGYSRIILFLKYSSNNRASTVYDLFLEAVGRYGLSSRIRCDQGSENVRIANHMLRHRAEGRSSVLVGSSVHNQCIEQKTPLEGFASMCVFNFFIDCFTIWNTMIC